MAWPSVRIALGGDARAELAAGERALVGQGALDDPHGAVGLGLGDALLAQRRRLFAACLGAVSASIHA